MNSQMWSHPATQENVRRLKEFGVSLIEPESGLLACGEDGPGRMAEPMTIEKAILEALRKDIRKERPVLFTFGGTREVIDGVRAITNTSTGQTGAELVDLFYLSGFDVASIVAKGSVRPDYAPIVAEFETHSDLNERMRDQIRSRPFAAVVHVAAVSDFSVDAISVGEQTFPPSAELKLSSDNRMTLQLRRNPKIVNLLKEYARDLKLKVIAFKLTKSADGREREEASLKLLNSPGVDYVVHNDLSDAEQDSQRRQFTIYSKGQPPLLVRGTKDLSGLLMSLIETTTAATPAPPEPKAPEANI
jgi:phosphopantothenoylcysteine decarboxylase/phosphopantothenate--cysteine ligase